MRRFVLLLLLVFLLPSVFAVKPSPQFSVSGVEVVYPKAQAYGLGDNFSVFIMAVNVSSGLPFSNDSVVCTFYVSNHTDNSIVFVKNFSYVRTYVFGVDIPSSVVGEVGFYPYAILCVNALGGIGGFVSDELLVSVDGSGSFSDFDLLLVLPFVFIPLFLSWLFIKWAGLIGEAHNVFKLFLSFGSLFLVLAGAWFLADALTKFVIWDSGVEALAIFIEVFGWLLFAIVGYWFVYMVYKIFKGVMKGNDGDDFEY